MPQDKFQHRKTMVADSKGIMVYKESAPNEIVLYLKPYDLEASKMIDLIDVIIDFLNKDKTL